jgi:hypothetical protein
MAENVICPICKSEAEAINVGLFDGVGFRCKTHGEFEVADGALAMHKDRSYSMGGRSYERKGQGEGYSGDLATDYPRAMGESW